MSTAAAFCEAGLAHFTAGRPLDARACYQQALGIDADHTDAQHLMGLLHLEARQYNDALEWIVRAIQRAPKPEYLASFATVLLQLGRRNEALNVLDKAIGLFPDHAPTLRTRAWVLYCLKRFEESAVDGRRAHNLDPHNAEICNNLGLALRRLRRNEEALAWFDKAIAIQPRFADAFDNRLVALFHLHRFDELFALSDRMTSLGLSNEVTEWNVSLAHLLTGNFEAGWFGHQTRSKLPSSRYPRFPQPMWLGGESVEGKTILIAADEGLGDTIHFARYIPMLAEQGARVLLAVQDPLHRLMSNLSGTSHCAPMSAIGTLPAFDLHCPISSLPLAFKTRLDTIPSEPYLPSPPGSLVQAWENRLGPRTRLRVGLVWSGDPSHVNDETRSIPLRTLSRILDVDADFISLQKALRPHDAAVLRERRDIIDLTAELTDFTDTAALICCLDLVITVDTSVAHLAGALGRPTWILLPWTPDYRWLLDRTDSPWYPSVRLFRQTETREYESVLDRVRDKLLAPAAAFRS